MLIIFLCMLPSVAWAQGDVLTEEELDSTSASSAWTSIWRCR